MDFDFETVRLDVSHGVYTKSTDSTVVIGIQGSAIVQTPVSKLKEETDFKNRKSKKAWWTSMNRITRVLAKYGYEEK